MSESVGSGGGVTLTVRIRVSPESKSGKELISLMKKYREALNYAIKVVIENKALSLSKAGSEAVYRNDEFFLMVTKQIPKIILSYRKIAFGVPKS